MRALGILFDIDALGGGLYGYKAARILFDLVAPEAFGICMLSIGDTNATLMGEANEFCIALQALDDSNLDVVRCIVGEANVEGLLTRVHRFLDDRLVRNEPLVISGHIDALGDLRDCETGWLQKAWDEAQAARGTAADLAAVEISETDPTVDWPVGAPGGAAPALGAGAGAEAVLGPGAGRRPEHRIGDVIGGKYRVLEVLRGGMGLVYIVDDLESLRERDVLLKLALKTFQDKFLFDDDAVRRFEREALNWVRLGWHPHIVYAMLVQQVAARPYIWLEFVDGESLAERLARGPIAAPEAVELALQFARGMRHAHEKHGLVHRDIKPANILISNDGVLKITDFGLSQIRVELAAAAARRLAEGRPAAGGPAPSVVTAAELAAAMADDSAPTVFATRPGLIGGTPAYIPPEVILDPQRIDARGDVYAFGIVLYEMLSRRLPFEGPDWFESHLYGEPVPLERHVPEVPAGLSGLVWRCLQKDPADRYQSFAEVEAALETVAAQLPERAAPVAPPELDETVRAPWFAAFSRAFSLMSFERFAEAIPAFEETLAQRPDDAEVTSNLGVCLGNLGRFEEARERFEKAVTLNPEYAEAWSNLGGVCNALGRHDRAAEACRRALKLKPCWAEAHANLGVSLARSGDLDQALACFYRALEVDPSYWTAHVAAAESLARAGRPPGELVPMLEKALAINPRDAHTLAFLAGALDELGRTDEAYEKLALALRFDAGNAFVQQVASILERRGGSPGSLRNRRRTHEVQRTP